MGSLDAYALTTLPGGSFAILPAALFL